MPDALHSSLDVPPISARHFVSFYQQPHYPVDIICDYLAEGLTAGEAVVAVATPQHAESITTELKGRGLHLDEMTSNGRFACADIAPTLAYLLDTKVSRQDKDAVMIHWVEETLERSPLRRCRFLGGLVSLLVAQGAYSVAFELEDIWNQILADYPAMLYCVYEQTPFEESPGLHNFCDVCNRHDAVLAAHLRAATGKSPSAWFVLLQEQASSLREEVMRRRMAERLVYVNEANRLTQLESLLRAHGPNLSPVEQSNIIQIVSELQAQARKEKRATVPESPEWHKKAGEILGYEKVIASVMRAGRQPNGDQDVS
jgi:hypothetical protein